MEQRNEPTTEIVEEITSQSTTHDIIVVLKMIVQYLESFTMDKMSRDVMSAAADRLESQEQTIAAWNRRTEQESELPTSSTPTNAQRIRSMSDEELARWLVDATVCERVCHEDEYCHGNECVKRVTDWLQQPAETEGTE